jgi:hypothetical protein
VRRAGQRGPDVHERDLSGEYEAQHEERPPLAGGDREPGGAAGQPGPQRDDETAQQEAHPRQTQRRRVEQSQLEGDRVAAPEQRHEEGEGGAPRVDRPDGVAQSGVQSDLGSETMDRRPL